MTRPLDEYPPGWLTQFRRGVVSGVSMFLLALLIVAVPTFLAWFAPGADSTTASAALKATVIIAVSGNRGGLILDGVPVTLTPLLVTSFLGWLVGWHARRPEETLSFIGLVVGYAAATAAGAAWADLGTSRVPVARSAVAALAFCGLVGSAVRFGPSVWVRLDRRRRDVLRAAAAALSGYLALGAALAGIALAAHLHEAATVQGRLAIGIGGLPVALLGLAALPNVAVAGVGYLTGTGFAVGSHTTVSPFAASHGKLPLFPLLAAIPAGPARTGLGVALMVAGALIAGWLAMRVLWRGRRAGAQPESAGRSVADLAVAALLTGAGLAVLSLLATGSLGPGALGHIGTTWWALGPAAAGLTMAGGAVGLAVTLALAGRSVPVAESQTTPAPTPPRERSVSLRKVDAGARAQRTDPVEDERLGRTG